MFNPGFHRAGVSRDVRTSRSFMICNINAIPEYFRRFDLPAWNLFLSLSMSRSRVLIAVSESPATI